MRSQPIEAPDLKTGVATTSRKRAVESAVAAALAITCVHPRDGADCRAGRHLSQAERVLALLRGQGYEVTSVGSVSSVRRGTGR